MRCTMSGEQSESGREGKKVWERERGIEGQREREREVERERTSERAGERERQECGSAGRKHYV